MTFRWTPSGILELEKTGTRTFVNVPDRKQIEVVDLARKTVIAKWPVTSALKNYPMALDETHHRVLIGCRAPSRMLVFDTTTGKGQPPSKRWATPMISFYDAARSRVYVIGGEGFVDVFANRAPIYHPDQHCECPGSQTGLFLCLVGESSLWQFRIAATRWLNFSSTKRTSSSIG